MSKLSTDEDILALILALIILLVIITLVSGGVLMFIWNVVVAGIFHGPAISYWQALVLGAGISILQSLFGRK